MSISNYTELQSTIARWLKRADLVADIPDFITLAEARIARDLRLRGQMAKATLTCTTGVQEVAFPSDYLEAENFSILVSGIQQNLRYYTSETSDERMPFGLRSGAPSYFTVIGQNIILGPTPDAAYTLNLDYYARIPALSVTPTNFLLTAAPGVYLFAALAEAAPFMMDDNRAIMWEAKYKAESSALQAADDQSVRSGSAMRVRTL